MPDVRFYNRDNDRTSLVDLIVECEIYHGCSEPDRKRFDHYLTALPPGVEFLVIESDKRIVGFISFSTLYSAIDAYPQFFIKEIFVTTDRRGQNLGENLMRKLVQLAGERSCTRIEWITDRNNTKAQRFYEKIGAVVSPKLVYRLEGDRLRAAQKELE